MAQADELIALADLHCHILPDWDDGPRTLDESLNMARHAAQSGLTHILVTPHVGRSFGSRDERAARDIPPACADLQRDITAAGIEITLVAGAELILGDPDLPARVGAQSWLTVGGAGRYALVEAPTHTWTDQLDASLFAISLHGVTPIIAHPERLADVQRDVSIMEKVAARGALLQITARSLINRERAGQDCSRRLLEAGLVSLVASDAHSSRSVLPAEVAEALCNIVGEAAAHEILVKNPLRVLAGEPVSPPTPEPKKSERGLWNWSRLLKRH